MRLNENMFQTIVTITTYNLTRHWSNIDKRIVPFHTYRQIYARIRVCRFQWMRMHMKHFG